MTKVIVNFKAVEQAAIEAFQDTCFLLGREFTDIITETGAFPSHPDRDIVDTGALRASQRLDFKAPGNAEFSWPVAYALYQHEGYTLRNGTEYQGRPWTKLGLERFDFNGVYGKLLKAKIDGNNSTGT